MSMRNSTAARAALKVTRYVGYVLTAAVALSIVSGGSTQIEIKPLKHIFKK
jgi:hypothetical protein